MEASANSPLVSIITPVYDKERYIREMIDSVVGQSYGNWELILVDDGSNDKSIFIASEYLDNRISILKRGDFVDKKGASVCRNIGLHVARGEFVIFLDADDLLKSNCLENRISIVNRHIEFDWWVMNMARFEGTVSNIKPAKFKDKLNKLRYYWARDKKAFFLKKFLTYNTFWSICNPIWRKSALDALGGFNDEFQRLQDPEIHTRALLSNLRIKFLKFELEADILVRDDEDRRGSINKIQMFERIAVSLECYINSISTLLKNSNKSNKLSYLYCYAILIEQITCGYSYRSDVTSEDKKYYLTRRDQFYNSISLPLSNKYLKFVNVYRYLYQNEFARKFRLPAILVNIYKSLV